MISRLFWIQRITQAWREAPIVWLAGVRRSGKTTLAHSLGENQIEYVNCDLPVVSSRVADPELFYRNCSHPIVVFDEVHRLSDPSRLLKIGADVFPHLKILATGSSTLAATRKFTDALTGRKRLVHLVPVLWDELQTFHHAPLVKRLYHGGLPQTLLADTKNPTFYREWMDSFFARDIQRLFAFRDPEKFHLFFEYVLKQSGGLFEISRTARALGLSRPTVETHLQALEITQVVTVVRPFHGGGQKELVKMPKVYGFDTGFVSYCRGWDPLRPEDYGALWEHLVLEYVQAHAPGRRVQYWRDVSGREIDFVIMRERDSVDVLECKWNHDHFDAGPMKMFRSYYPRGHNYILSPITGRPYMKKQAGMEILVCNPDGWRTHGEKGHADNS